MAGAPYAPQFDLEPERTVSRAPGYWIGLYSLLIAMILLQFVGYMNRDKLPTEEPTPTSFDRELKQFATDDTTEVAIARALGMRPASPARRTAWATAGSARPWPCPTASSAPPRQR